MTAGFGEVLRERALERVRDEVDAFFGAYGDAATAAIYEGDFGALERSTEEFAAALKAAIPLWFADETVAKEEAPEAEETKTTATAETPAGAGQERRSSVTTQVTKTDVEGAVEKLAKQEYPVLARKNPGAARSKIWSSRPDLREAHDRAENPVTEGSPAPVAKEAPALAKRDAAVEELRKAHPERSTGELRRMALERDPSIYEEYRRLSGS